MTIVVVYQGRPSNSPSVKRKFTLRGGWGSSDKVNPEVWRRGEDDEPTVYTRGSVWKVSKNDEYPTSDWGGRGL